MSKTGKKQTVLLAPTAKGLNLDVIAACNAVADDPEWRTLTTAVAVLVEMARQSSLYQQVTSRPDWKDPRKDVATGKLPATPVDVLGELKALAARRGNH